MSIGERLKAERLKRGLTQTMLARLAGVSQPDVSRTENGREFDTGIVARVETALAKVEPVVKGPDLFEQRVKFVAVGPEVPLEARWKHAGLSFGDAWVDDLLQRVRDRPDGERSLSILATIPLDSSLEAVFLGRLIDDGWEFMKARPLSLGCRMLIRDRRKNVYVGDVRRWVLRRTFEGYTIILIPQVTMVARGGYRVDVLGIVTDGPRRAFFIAEMDGPHHAQQKSRDRERTLDLKLPVLRITGKDMMGDISRDLLAFAAPLCVSKPPTVFRWS
ncbi:MAG TPA: helix-turn-helix transcriptional regulator [Candidatus Xenobia bacterium]